MVDYLDGDNAGVVVFGLNRPEVFILSGQNFKSRDVVDGFYVLVDIE